MLLWAECITDPLQVVHDLNCAQNAWMFSLTINQSVNDILLLIKKSIFHLSMQVIVKLNLQ